MLSKDYLDVKKFTGHDNEEIEFDILFTFLDKYNFIANDFYYIQEFHKTCECGDKDNWSVFDSIILYDSKNKTLLVSIDSDNDFEQYELQIYICETCGRWGTYIRQ